MTNLCLKLSEFIRSQVNDKGLLPQCGRGCCCRVPMGCRLVDVAPSNFLRLSSSIHPPFHHSAPPKPSSFFCECLLLSHHVCMHTIHSLLSICFFFYLPFFLKIAFSLSFSKLSFFLYVSFLSLSFLNLNGFKLLILFLLC